MSLMGSTSGLCSAALFPVLYVIPCYTGGCYNGTGLYCLMSVMAFKSPSSPLLIQQLVQVNTLRPRQDGCHFADDTFKRIFLNGNFRISIKISLKFVAKSPINNIPALVQIMAWSQSGDKPLSEPMMVSFLLIYASFGLNELTKYQRITLLTFIVQMHGSLVDSPHKRPVMWTEFPSWHHHIQHNCSDNAQTRTLKKDTIAHPHTGAMGASYEYFADNLLYYNKAIYHWLFNMLNYFKDHNICIHNSYHILDFVQQKKTNIRNGATLHVAYPVPSIPYLLMPWEFKEPGHQQAWYWLNELEYSFSGIRRVDCIPQA